MISGKAMVCGVIGNPVGHSLSPMMHNFFGTALGLDFVYVPCHVENADVETALKGAYALGFQGLNVTVPHKQRVMPYLAELDEAAKGIGAVNTLVRQEHGYKGYNTDAAGLLQAMEEQDVEIRGRDCLVLGAGGAAKAVSYMLMKERAASVTVLNRTLDKARRLAEEMNLLFGRDAMKAAGLEDWEKLPGEDYLAVQTTSVGMYPQAGHAPIENPAFYERIRMAVDIIYTPAETEFMRLVRKAGGRAMGGLDMLIYQGIIALKLWNPQITVPDDVVRKARSRMEEILKK